jgi:hypothetical protein
VGILRPGVIGIVVVELVAVGWLRVTMLTRYKVRPDATAGVDTAGTGSAPSAAGGHDGSSPVGPVGPALAAVRGLGRLTGGARQRLPDAQEALESGARQMGAHTGRLQRAWRRATR